MSTIAPSPTPSPSITEFRRNTERQRREQNSVGNVLKVLVYSLIGGLILVGSLAGFGGYALYSRIQDQAQTVAQVDSKIDRHVETLTAELEQIKKFCADQTVFDQQTQDRLAKITSLTEKLSSQSDKLNATLRDEKDSRARDMLAIQKRLQKLESRPAGKVQVQ